jgi:hypothetical protein
MPEPEETESVSEGVKEGEVNLTRFFAWARARALAELEARLAADPALDPNWTFSDIMQELLEEYRRARPVPSAPK